MPPTILNETDLLAAVARAPSNRTSEGVGHPIERFNRYGELIRAHCEMSAERKWRYTSHPNKNNSGIQNHFQGMVRLNKPGWIAISGSNWKELSSEIFFVRLTSATESSPWLSNVARDKTPLASDAVPTIVQLRTPPRRPNGDPPRERILWHGGGMDTVGNVLAIPIEHTPDPALGGIAGITVPSHAKNSAIRFLDVSNPRQPRLYTNGITRDNTRAGAVALTRLKNGYYLCGVWSDADPGLPDRMDFYLSVHPRFDGRFRQNPSAVVEWVPNPSVRVMYQATCLVSERTGLYLIGFQKAGGAHRAEAYRLNIVGGNVPPPNATSGITAVEAEALDPVEFRGGDRFCNFAAASGCFVDEGGRLLLYSGEQWRRNDQVVITEFREPLARPARLTAHSAWIELYSKPEMDGPTLTIRDVTGDRASIRNYKKVYARERHFGDKTWSIRYCLPVGMSYDLFEHDNYRKHLRTLVGTGKVEQVSLAALGVEEKLSSSRVAV